jgi:uncharacterized protein (DUF488 family)
MYYRRKLLLAIIEKSGNKLNKTRLQKLLLLITRTQDKKTFDFVPYKYGCYSFSANQDLKTMIKYNLIKEEKDNNSSYWINISEESFFSQLKVEDKSAINSTLKEFDSYSNEELIRYTYNKYPFWAINSEIANRILNEDEFNKVINQKKTFKEQTLFTIGYEGVSLETYLNKLIINDVRLLIDVRKNSLSMKYGFSKSQLKHACEGVGIKYLHQPELGIDSDKRQELNTLEDYKKLFKEYENTTLKSKQNELKYIIDLLSENTRIALTCFEKEHCMCHRGKIVENLTKTNKSLTVKHL